MEGKNIAYVALAGVGAYAAYKLLSKPEPVEPGLVYKVSVNYRGPQPGSLITWDNKIVAEITWTNQGQSDIKPGFKLSMKPAYSLQTPIGDESTRAYTPSPVAKPGQTVTLTADSPYIPPNWKQMIYVPPFTIEMRLLLYDGGSGFLWDNQVVSISDTSMKIEGLDVTVPPNLVVAPGDSYNGSVSFRYTGPDKVLSLHYGLGIFTGVYPVGYWTTEPTIPVKQFGVSLPAGTDLLITKQFAFPVPSTAKQKEYDSMAVMYDGAIELSDTRDVDDKVVTISSVVIPTLTASHSGGITSFQYSGFQPNSQVAVYVTQTGGGVYTTSNSDGSYSGSFYNTDPVGNYTLRAYDNYGHSATTAFTI